MAARREYNGTVYRDRVMAVYAIVHKRSGRAYVGSSTCIAKRWSYHRIVLRKRVHENALLQACWDGDGAAAFEWRILETITDTEQLIPREQYWIDTLGSTDPSRGFNVLPTAGSFRGRTLTAEHKRKIGAASKGHTVSAEQRAVIAAKAMGNHRGIDNLTRYRESRMVPAETVARIRIALASGQSRAAIIAQFGLPDYTVARIISGRCYPDIHPELIEQIRAGTSLRRSGEHSHRAKLTEQQLRDIWTRLSRGDSMVSIAADLSVTAGAISQIKHGHAWGHVTRFL
jgi:group I intron endonuclease